MFKTASAYAIELLDSFQNDADTACSEFLYKWRDGELPGITAGYVRRVLQAVEALAPEASK